jgi:Family of unknown function (DUF6807)
MFQAASIRPAVGTLSGLLLLILSLCTALPTWAQVKITQGPEQIAVDIDGKPFTVVYIGGTDLNRPYLHPLRSASGRIVNRSFPAGQLPGETTDHPHHAGLFYGHGDVNGYNYWPSRTCRPLPRRPAPLWDASSRSRSRR